MATLADLKKVKIESELPKNSNEVVTNVRGKIRSVNTQQMGNDVKLFINLETESGLHFADVVTFKDGSIDRTLRYLSMHAGHIFKQFGNDYSSFTETIDEVMSQLESVKASGKFFKMSTVKSEHNDEYVDVLYGDEQPRTA